jgi:Na+/melibiose symporter-like transporter
VELIIYPTLAVLPAFYASLSGRNLAEFATALLVSRSVYSWSGPLVGYLSDRIATPWGRRKPWMFVGLLVALASIVLLFRPPPGAGPAYFAWTSTLAFASFSLIDIPYVAWGSEITRDAAERSRIAAWRQTAALAALLVFAVLPYLPGFGGGTLLSPLAIERTGIVAFVIVAVTIGVVLRWGPPPVPERTARAGESVVAVLRSVLTNGPFWPVAAATFFSYVGFSLVLSLQLPFLASLGLAKQYGIVVIVSYGTAIVCMPLWTALAARAGKKRTWLLGLAATLLSPALYFALRSRFDQQTAVIVSSVVLNAASVVQFMPYSVLGDVIDYDELRSGVNRAASYTSLLLLVIRLTTAVAGAVAFALLARFGFRIGAPNGPAAQNGMLLVFLGLPALCSALALASAALYPLTARRHALIVEQLRARTQVADDSTA